MWDLIVQTQASCPQTHSHILTFANANPILHRNTKNDTTPYLMRKHEWSPVYNIPEMTVTNQIGWQLQRPWQWPMTQYLMWPPLARAHARRRQRECFFLLCLQSLNEIVKVIRGWLMLAHTTSQDLQQMFNWVWVRRNSWTGHDTDPCLLEKVLSNPCGVGSSTGMLKPHLLTKLVPTLRWQWYDLRWLMSKSWCCHHQNPRIWRSGHGHFLFVGIGQPYDHLLRAHSGRNDVPVTTVRHA